MTLNAKQINKIYFENVLVNNNEEYLNRYNTLPDNNKNWKWEGKSFARVITVLEFQRLIKKYNIKIDKLLMYNGDDPELEFINPSNIVRINYDEVTSDNDLNTLNLNIKDFDFVLFSQTLEHVLDPVKCVKNLFNHMRHGGGIFTSVPVINIAHSTPFHFYSGFTPVGLGAIFKEAGFEILEIGQWGNAKYLELMMKRGYWADYRQLKRGINVKADLRYLNLVFQNGLSNDFDKPADCWILALKS